MSGSSHGGGIVRDAGSREERPLSTEIGKEISKARALLEHGLLVAIPTETVYGLAANALNADAVLRIFEVKARPTFDPLIVHGASREALEAYVATFPEWARQLADRFWPGPLTLILPKKPIIPDIVTSGLDTVAVRVPRHAMTLGLLEELGLPLAAPSANPFGYISPTTPQHVMDQLGGKISYILDGGPCGVGIESTIVGERNGKIVILRLGGLAASEIEQVIGPVEIDISSTSDPTAPGKLESHYAPRTPLLFGPITLVGRDPLRVGVIAFQTLPEGLPDGHGIALSPHGDTHEAAKGLFAAMRTLDALDLDIILAEPMPETGLGPAMNDRLRRAMAR